MTMSKIALVTGASRGVGKGVARSLAENGYVVYVTGRSTPSNRVSGWDGKPLPGTVDETVNEIIKNGGKAVPVLCDHGDDQQVAQLFEQIETEQNGHLDILVNNATYIHSELIDRKPFWEKGLEAQNILDVGLRTSYVASWHAAKIMSKNNKGLIVFTSSFGASCYMHGPAYGAQKAGIDKLAHDMAVDLKPFNVNTISIWMGLVLTERTRMIIKLFPEKYGPSLETAETPEFIGYIIHAIAHDEKAKDISGHRVIAAEIAKERYGITDQNNQYPPSHREMLGAPPAPNPVIID